VVDNRPCTGYGCYKLLLCLRLEGNCDVPSDVYGTACSTLWTANPPIGWITVILGCRCIVVACREVVPFHLAQSTANLSMIIKAEIAPLRACQWRILPLQRIKTSKPAWIVHWWESVSKSSVRSMPDRLAIDHLKTHRTKVHLHKYVLSSSLHNRTNPLTLYVWG
jgi:hypothetical protein